MLKPWHLIVLTFLFPGFIYAATTQDVRYHQEVMASGLNVIVWETVNDDEVKNAELKLVIKTGSLAEQDNEQGFAHFVEHLAFNNTAKYPKETLFRELEAFGLGFGAHSNAHTAFDSTVYKLTLKDVTEEKLDKALEILAQWAIHVQFDQKTVDAEKGVIREEWRLRQPQEEGWQARYIKALYKNSRYAERLPIGNIEVIEAAGAAGLEAFYQRWYQPANSALIVTGHIQPEVVNKLVAKYFSTWEQTTETSNKIYNVDTTELPAYLALADKKVDSNSLQFSYFSARSRPNTRDEVYERQVWLAGLDILDQRLTARLQETVGKVAGIHVSWNYLSPAVMTVSVGAVVPGDGLEIASRLLAEETAYLLKHGVTDDELNAWKLKTLERNRTFKDNARSQANLALRHVLYGNPLQEQAEWFSTLEQRLPTLDTAMVNAALRGLLAGRRHTLMIHNPAITVPAEAELQQWLAEAKTVAMTRPAPVAREKESGEWLLSPESEGEISASRKIGDQIEEWTLNNGIKVYYRYSDHQPGKVWYELSASGGTNLLKQQETIQARLALETIAASGLRAMSGPELTKWLTNQNMQIQPYYGFFERGLYGRSSRQGFTKLMRLVHIALTEGRVAEPAWQHNLENNRQQLKQLAKSRTKPWRDLNDRILYNNDAAFRLLTEAELDAVKPEQLLAIYQHRFAGAQNYRMTIVGDVSAEAARAAVLESIATLPPSSASSATSAPLSARPFPRIVQSEEVDIAGSGERGAALIYKLTLAKEHFANLTFAQLSYLRPWLDAVLLETLREKDGLVYSVGVRLESGMTAVKDYTLTIQLSCDPDKVPAVKKRIVQILQELTEKPPQQARLLAWQKSRAASLADDLQKPSRLVSAILFTEYTGLPLEKLDDIAYRTRLPEAEELTALLAALTGDKAKKVWMTWLP